MVMPPPDPPCAFFCAHVAKDARNMTRRAAVTLALTVACAFLMLAPASSTPSPADLQVDEDDMMISDSDDGTDGSKRKRKSKGGKAGKAKQPTDGKAEKREKKKKKDKEKKKA